MPSAETTFGFVTEAEVRRLCGRATYARADTLEREDHVLAATAGDALSGRVRGTWHRVYEVSVRVAAGKPVVTCTCGAGVVCRHAGALLLHWARRPQAFARPAPVAAPALPGQEDEEAVLEAVAGGSAAAGAADLSPAAEIAAALERDSMAHLRQMARLRRATVKGVSKAELVAQLGAALSDPANVDAALAALGRDQQMALEAAVLLEAIEPTTDKAIAAGSRALGVESEAAARQAVEALADRGLLLSVPAATGYGPVTWHVPRAALSRLPPRADLVRRRDDRAARGGGRPARLDAAELLYAVAVEAGGVRLREPAAREQELAPYLPLGWIVDQQAYEEEHHAPVADLAALFTQIREMPLVPAPLLAEGDDARVAARLGVAPPAVAMAVAVLLSLGVLTAAAGSGRPRVEEERLVRLLELAREERWALIGVAWLNTLDWSALRAVAGRSGPLQLRYQLGMAYYGHPPVPLAGALRMLLARMMGRLAPDTWYDLDALLGVLWRLAPRILGPGRPMAGYPGWRFVERGRAQTPLNPESRDGWARICGRVAVALLEGPLTWLGCVETTGLPPIGDVPSIARGAGDAAGDQVQSGARDERAPGGAAGGAVRVLAPAAIFAGRPPRAAQEPGRVPLVFGPDMTVLVPAGSTQPSVHALLARAGDLLGATPEGLRYRLTADKVQQVFDSGLDGPALIDFLATAGGLPGGVRETLERWWRGFGAVRLYDDLTLMELGDDTLLPELLRTTNLGAHVLETYSPRLVAVDAAAVDEIVAALTRLGHAPRVVE